MDAGQSNEVRRVHQTYIRPVSTDEDINIVSDGGEQKGWEVGGGGGGGVGEGWEMRGGMWNVMWKCTKLSTDLWDLHCFLVEI